MELVTYLVTGGVAGLLAGLLGIGGGLVIVPALAFLFAGHGIAGAHLMHLAVGTSLAAIIPTAIASSLAHHRRDSVHWPAVRALLPGIIVGALSGAWLARHISSPTLALCFGVFEILVALQLWFGAKPSAHRVMPGATVMTVAGIGIGAISALLGIGGATMTILSTGRPWRVSCYPACHSRRWAHAWPTACRVRSCSGCSPCFCCWSG
jgi:uncharacterized membrane protein YfcA